MTDRRVFAIADLHLSHARPKPMDQFGPAWQDHALRLREQWMDLVCPGDIVLVAGDVSWAMRLAEARSDLEWLASLPGEKVIVRGNHDYWWQGITRVRQAGGPGLHFVQHDAVLIGDIAVTGTRLWDFTGVDWPAADPGLAAAPGAQAADFMPVAVREPDRPSDDDKIRARELERLRLGLSRLPDDAAVRIVLVHYPPLGADGRPTPITDILNEHGIDICVFGHVHSLGPDARPGADCRIGPTRFVLASCDWLGCRPKQVLPR